MKIMKFGGTSVGSVSGLRNIKRIVEAEQCPVVVVVSALSGVTDKLLSASGAAESGDVSFRDQYNEIRGRHSDMICNIFDSRKLRTEIDELQHPVWEELKNLLEGVYMLGVMPEKTGSQIAGIGERLSSIIVTALIRDAVLFDSLEFIRTRKLAGKVVLDEESTKPLVRQAFKDFHGTAIVPGFISRDSHTGDFTTLGRGGSDYTASILAAALCADSLEIWTDVDGFMTSDPRIVRQSSVIDSLDFDEAMELCHFGAKVLYAPSLYPVYPANIPIFIRNTFNPGFKGTVIKKLNAGGSHPVTGITSVDRICLLTLSGPSLAGIVGIDSRLFSALTRRDTSAFLVTQSSSETGISVGVTDKAAEIARAAVEEEFSSEIEAGAMNRVKLERGLASVAVVGPSLKQTHGMASSLFTSLARIGVNVLACAQGSSDHNISIIIRSADLKPALNVIHDRFFLPEEKSVNLFICGIGTVGAELIRQIAACRKTLSSDKSLRINVLGVSRSTVSLFDPRGVNLAEYREDMEKRGTPMSPQEICDAIISMEAPDSIFVDCSSSIEISGIYGSLLEAGVSVVTANKCAASSPYDNYAALKVAASTSGASFLFETNVGAGLPVIKTIAELRDTGDEVENIEAVVSGTLNYILNTVSASVPFSKAVLMAKEKGYSEPDPRTDLSLLDVIRKITILAREAGYVVDMENVEISNFVPVGLFEGSLDDFWDNLPSFDDAFELLRHRAAEERKRLRFIARMAQGRCSASLEEVAEDHPFYNLPESENAFLITTRRYHDRPMLIGGYGAGAAVTAAGVFADILKAVR